MKKILLIALLIVGCVFGRERYVAIGFLDHKTGISLVGYARTLKETKKHEYFIGACTMISSFTASAGWKYYFNDAPIQFYSVLLIQGVNGMGGGFIAPVISLGVEKKNFIKNGLLILVLFQWLDPTQTSLLIS